MLIMFGTFDHLNFGIGQHSTVVLKHRGVFDPASKYIGVDSPFMKGITDLAYQVVIQAQFGIKNMVQQSASTTSVPIRIYGNVAEGDSSSESGHPHWQSACCRWY